MHSSKPLLALELDGRAGCRGRQLLERALALAARLRPSVVVLGGSEPLAFRDELGILLPAFDRLGIEVVLVTRARIPIPIEFGAWDNLNIVVKVDAVPDPRVLANLDGASVAVHCEIPRHLAPGRLHELADFWSAREEVYRICFSFAGDLTEEAASLGGAYPKIYLREPPACPAECAFPCPLGGGPVCAECARIGPLPALETVHS